LDIALDAFDKLINEYLEPGAIQVLVGCKADLEEERAVPTEVARQIAIQKGLHHFETSARNGIGIEEMFRFVSTSSTFHCIQDPLP
jgi:hypothetical protein